MTGDKDPVSLAEVAALVSEALDTAGISAVLSGGAAVSLYADNQYQTADLDFISSASLDKIQEALSGTGYERTSGRYFRHPQIPWFLEFPAGPVAFGDQYPQDFATLQTKAGNVRIVMPTQCVMDRLVAFYHWNDRQCLDQAVLVASGNDVDSDAIRRWSENEGKIRKFELFLARLSR